MAASRRITWLHTAVLCGAVVACYANSLPGQFVFDDAREIVANPRIREIPSLLGSLLRRRGLVELTLAVNFHFGGLDPRGYHIFNVALHAAATLLVYAFVRLLLTTEASSRSAGRSPSGIAFLVALLFAVHPLQTAAVTYVIQRAEVMAAAFHLLAVVTLLLAAHARSPLRRLLAGSAVCASSFLAMMAKEVGIAAPFAVTFLDLAVLSRWQPRRALRRWPIYAGLAVILAFFLAQTRDLWLPSSGAPAGAQTAPSSPAEQENDQAPQPQPQPARAAPRTIHQIPTAGLAVEDITPLRYFLSQPRIILHYLRLYLVPVGLTFDYGWPPAESAWELPVILSFTTLVLLLALAVLLARQRPLITFAIGWFFIALAPTSSIVPLRDLAFEHRMYLPVAAVSLALALAGRELLAWRRWPRLGVIALGLWVIGLAGLTIQRNTVYHDRLRFFRDSARKAPWNWRPHYDVGNELMKRAAERYRAGDVRGMEQLYREAADAFRLAIQADPTHGPPHIHLALLLRRWGRFAEAERELREATRARERSVVAMAWWQLGDLYLQQGRRDDAIAALQRAAELMPSWEGARARLRALGVQPPTHALGVQPPTHSPKP